MPWNRERHISAPPEGVKTLAFRPGACESIAARRPPSQGWKTFLRNHADGIAAMDLFVVPTLSFRRLYGLLILRQDRRRILWASAIAHPTSMPTVVFSVNRSCARPHYPHGRI